NAEITIIPDGPLAYIPFEALLSDSTSRENSYFQLPFLLKEYTFNYGYSATLQTEMLEKEPEGSPSAGLIAFAPSFPSEQDAQKDRIPEVLSLDLIPNQRAEHSPLSNNIPEANAVSQITNGTSITGERATKKAFLREAPKHQIIHLSTHGKANDELGEYAYLVFQDRPEGSPAEERLYNNELYSLRLNADLVVLSACETGIGELNRGEGVISLARGFSFAGAKSIVTSLWNVNDQSTRSIMEYFYQHLRVGLPKHRALQQAKLDYLEAGNSSEAALNPFYWAAFIQIGDQNPIKFPTSQSWIVWLIILGGSLFGLYMSRRNNV
ncbi:MAG: CHAT domain-containing protein, partial [Bacteroidota bacterium]